MHKQYGTRPLIESPRTYTRRDRPHPMKRPNTKGEIMNVYHNETMTEVYRQNI